MRALRVAVRAPVGGAREVVLRRDRQASRADPLSLTASYMTKPENNRPAPGPDPLRRSRLRALSAALVRALDGLRRGAARAAGRRHLQHRERLQQLPPPAARADRGGRARRARGGRPAARVPDHLARRAVPQPDQPDVPQPHEHGRRGDDPRPADGCGRAGRRLRQDRAGAADGRALGRQAGAPAGRRADDDRALPRGAPWRLHRLPALLGRVPGRAHRRARDPAHRDASRHHRRHLPRDGHGEHHGVPRRDARHDACRARRPSRRCTPTGCARARRAACAPSRWRRAAARRRARS